MNKLALSVTKLASTVLKKSVRASRKIMGWDVDTAAKSLCAFDEEVLARALMSVAIKK